MSNLLVFAGKKQSGKSSSGNFIAGYQLLKNNKIKGFAINDKGDLVVNATFKDESGNWIEGQGVLDLLRQDFHFLSWASSEIFPIVKIYNFSTKLKEIAINVFGLEYRQVYGTDEDKNSITHIKWKDMSRFLPPRSVKTLKQTGKYDSFMTGREFLQFFGTDICRTLYNNCWVNYCLNQIEIERPNLAIITDCRFDNEFYGCRKRCSDIEIDCRIIKLERSISQDSHKSEDGLSSVLNEEFDAVLDNQEMSQEEKNQLVLDNAYKFGFVE